MLGTWIRDDPDGGLRISHRRIGDELAKMVVVRPLELVFDDDRSARLVLGHEINVERASSLLAPGAHEGEAANVVQDIDVLLQPSREVVRLVLPNLAERDALDPADGRTALLWRSGRSEDGRCV